ncbi:MAG: helix-turn-helix transcriptional regulator [Firmicutes bacterium]|nr:helix-turn-helix transcriptional regulator [Bacillota bacterium]
MLISERIYQYMKEKGITQLEFAKRTGISQSTVSDWRRKGTNPSADKIMIICDVLGISPYELLLGTENEKLKNYNQPDYVIIDKNSRVYMLVETFQHLDSDAQKRVEGYMEALKSMTK